jgi:hypothetical protein
MTLPGSDDEAILAALNIIFKTSFTKEFEYRRLLGPCPEVLESQILNKETSSSKPTVIKN